MNNKKVITAISLGFIFSLMLIPVSILEFLLPTNGADSLVYYKRLVIGLGFNFLFSFFIPFALFMFTAVIRKSLFLVLASMNVVFVTASVLHIKIYQQLMAAPSLIVLLDTNLKEATEFAEFYSSGSTVGIALLTLTVMSVISVWAWRVSNSAALAGFNKMYAIGAFFILAFLGNFGWNKIYFTLGNPIPFYIQIGGDVLASREDYQQIANSKPKHTGAKLVETVKKPMTHLIIIGESATSSHMSLYGYERETNPLLKQPFRGMNFLLSKNNCSSKHATYSSIADVMLGGNPLKLDAQGLSPPNMMSTFKDAGYQTYWISNQPGAGYGSMVSFWSATVDNSIFLNTRDYRIGYNFDEVLLPSVELALKENGQHQVVVMHMMGSHPGYKQRYPKKFEHWNDRSEVPDSVSRKEDSSFEKAVYNAYDNSMLYSDYIVSSIVSIAAKYNVASVVYFSDHGQNLGEKSAHIGHSTESGPKQGYEVPLLFWLNFSELKQLDLDTETFKSNLEKPFSLERIQYTLFDLYGIKLPVSYANESLFSHRYQVVKRHCDGMKY